ncbi:hypothetical protein CLCR_00974 [Cladophialophora carrionii]|uniref:ATPase AAA-type core domain-containing protein n=1 Tax=Cladophialophora carrionii TaxID=86049 RepID=A0A1C1D0R6_9EURO|nr:hypothetical protein CLCR_00974 [Cladophialophora carrionii]
MSTVILDEETKSSLLQDLTDFFQPSTPRGFLWHGSPGTGKSSSSVSIAGEFGLDIYMVNLSSIDDKGLLNLFPELPQRCLVLLEDIDATSSKRAEVTDLNWDPKNIGSPPKREIREKVSLSPLLNVIDGIGAPEGRVLIMTTNHVELLDDALVRPAG